MMKEVSDDPVDNVIPFSPVTPPQKVRAVFSNDFSLRQNRPSAAKKKPTTFDSDDSDEFDPTPAKRGRR